MPRYSKKHTFESFSLMVQKLNEKQGDEQLPHESTLEEKLSELLNNSYDKVSMSSFNRDIGEEFGAEEYDVPDEVFFKRKQDATLWEKNSFEYLKVDHAGMQTHGDLTFFGLFALTDAGIPCFLVVYFDDKDRLRAYVPKKGNAYNSLYKSCLGMDPDGDDEYMETLGYEESFMDKYEEDADFRLSLYDNELLIKSIVNRIIVK